MTTVSPDLHPSVTRRGLMLVLSSPSGAGKTTLSRRLLESESGRMSLSISATTRPRRTNEVEGRDYFFVSDERFRAMVEGGDFLEHATVHHNRYGTPRAPVERELAAGRDVLFDIDWQGTRQVKEQAGADLVTVFVLPPDAEALPRRLRTRAQDSEAVIRQRLAGAIEELEHFPEYDYVLVNEDVETALVQLEAILSAERLRRARQQGLEGLVEEIRAGLARYGESSEEPSAASS